MWWDLENHQYAYKDEVFTTDKKIIKGMVTAVNNGDITIDGNVMNELVELITGETDREKIVDPY